jgi:hypothetical protein
VDLERQLEGFQVMGIKYTEIAAAGTGRGATAPDLRRPATLPPGGYFDAGTGRVRNAFKETEAFGPYQVPGSLEPVKRRAEQLNANGKIAQKFGMKVLVHNRCNSTWGGRTSLEWIRWPCSRRTARVSYHNLKGILA